jgi:hypothetical protein
MSSTVSALDVPDLRAADPRMRNTAIGLLAAGALLLFGLLSHAWFDMRGDAVGLLGIESCYAGSCSHVSWFDLPAPSELKMFSAIGITGIAGAVAFLLQAAIALFKRRAKDVQLTYLNASLALAAFGCTSLFCYLTFSTYAAGVSVGYAGVITLAAVIAASILTTRLVRPMAKLST